MLERVGSEPIVAQLAQMPDQAKKLAKETAELSIPQTLALVKSHYPGLELEPVGEGTGEECTAERFKELLGEVTPVAKAISEDLDL